MNGSIRQANQTETLSNVTLVNGKRLESSRLHLGLNPKVVFRDFGT